MRDENIAHVAVVANRCKLSMPGDARAESTQIGPFILSRARGAGSPSKPTRPLRATTRHGAETL